MFPFGKAFYGLMNPSLIASSLMGKYMLGLKQENNPLYTLKTVKHGGDSINDWEAISCHSNGPLVKINGNCDQYKYKDTKRNGAVKT